MVLKKFRALTTCVLLCLAFLRKARTKNSKFTKYTIIRSGNQGIVFLSLNLPFRFVCFLFVFLFFLGFDSLPLSLRRKGFAELRRPPEYIYIIIFSAKLVELLPCGMLRKGLVIQAMNFCGDQDTLRYLISFFGNA